jgi:hypothetical protein
VLVQLAALVMAPPGRWSRDRGPSAAFRPSMALPVVAKARAKRNGR